MSRYHSTFTPSQSDADTLEALFVARQDLAHDLMESIWESASTGAKQQLLIVGPRGIGKTHLTALLVHRIRSDTALSERLCLAWLAEDPYLASYADLLVHTLQRLAADENKPELAREADAALDEGSLAHVERRLEVILQRTIGAKTLLMVVENLDELLRAIGAEGQHKLRAFIQTHQNVSLLATSTSLSAALTDRRQVFFGFFKTTPLGPLTLREAVELLAAMARHARKHDLAAALREPLGMARIRAVHYLAGGNPRVYAVFFDFLTRQSLDELVSPFMRLVDELTPYYQACMSRLATLQRRLVDILRRHRGAMTVKDIARQAMSSSQTVSHQLGLLRELGYVVQAQVIGRNSYYELREPLMRLCLDVKEVRGQMLTPLIEFLRIWHSPKELEELSAVRGETSDRDYFNHAARNSGDPDPVLRQCLAEVDRLERAREWSAALNEIAVAIERDKSSVSLRERQVWLMQRAGATVDQQLQAWEQVAAIDQNSVVAWMQVGRLALRTQRLDLADRASLAAVESMAANAEAFWLRAEVLETARRTHEAREAQLRALALEAKPKQLEGWRARGSRLFAVREYDEAIAAFLSALDFDPTRLDVWSNLLGALQKLGLHRITLEISRRLAHALPDAAPAIGFYATCLAAQGDLSDSVDHYERALRIDPEIDRSYYHFYLYRAHALNHLGRYASAIAALESSPDRDNEYRAYRLLVRADALMGMDDWDRGLAALDEALRTAASLDSFEFRTISTPLIISNNRDVWRRYVQAYIEAARKYNLLAQIGQDMAYRSRIFFTFSSITADAVLAWADLWSELAADIEPLQLPLRLLRVVARVKADANLTAMLELPREERGLLEPWLQNLLHEPEENRHRILERVNALIERIGPLQEDRLAQAFWSNAQAGAGAPIDFDRVLSDYGQAHDPDAPARLLKGNWQTTAGEHAKQQLQRLAAAEPRIALALTRPSLRVLAIDELKLSFASARLVQVHAREGTRLLSLDLLDGGDKHVLLLDGSSSPLYAWVKARRIRLKTPQARSDYVRLFCSVLRNESARFRVVDDLFVSTATADEDAKPLEQWHALPDSQDLRFRGTVMYAGDLFVAELELREKDGFVEMVSDSPLMMDAGSSDERFDGPLRVVVPTGHR